MTTEIKIHKLDPFDQKNILKIANWYNDEWNTPIEKTINRLSNQPNADVFFQLVLSKEDKVITTGGLCNEVNLLKIHPEFKALGPWVALLYTDQKHRSQGLGKALLEQIEYHAHEHNLEKIYLYTFTAEALYKKSGWTTIATVKYKNEDTAVMEKIIK